MATKTPNENALRLIAAELKATRVLQGKFLAKLTVLENHVKGIVVALGEREHDFEAKHEALGQAQQATHERVVGIERRVERAERALKLRPA